MVESVGTDPFRRMPRFSAYYLTAKLLSKSLCLDLSGHNPLNGLKGCSVWLASEFLEGVIVFP